MPTRLTPAPLFALLLMSASVNAQTPPAGGLQLHLDALSAFDYPTRTMAARLVRRTVSAEAVPALTQAVRSHPDQYVRYRALVLLTGFNDRTTPTLMRSLVGDRNDRVREVVYRWYERNPDPAVKSVLLAALDTEQSEFVRPALVRAVAALPPDPDVQRTLMMEAGRGLDFFRSAVIEALGEHGAGYAVKAVASAAVLDGPLQDDAVLALGRIGGPDAVATLVSLSDPPNALMPALQAAQCMLGDNCERRLMWLSDAARSPAARPETVRAAISALGAVASHGNDDAIDLLLMLARSGDARLRADAGRAISGVALRRAEKTLAWLEAAPEAARTLVIELLRDGFESLEEDFAEEQFFASARAAYWAAPDGSGMRRLIASLIETLEF